MTIDTTTNIYGSTVTYFISLLRTNVTDVSVPTAVGTFEDARANTSSWIVANFPQPKKYGNFPGYPIIIVKSPDSSEDYMGLSNVNQNVGQVSFIVLDKNSSLVNADGVAAQIKNVIRKHWSSTNAVGIAQMRLSSSTNSDVDVGDDTIMRRLDYDLVYRALDNYV